MSEREQVKQIIDSLPDYKILPLLRFLKGVQFDDELEDELFCVKLVDEYEHDSNRGDFVSFEDALHECGVPLDEL